MSLSQSHYTSCAKWLSRHLFAQIVWKVSNHYLQAVFHGVAELWSLLFSFILSWFASESPCLNHLYCALEVLWHSPSFLLQCSECPPSHSWKKSPIPQKLLLLTTALDLQCLRKADLRSDCRHSGMHNHPHGVTAGMCVWGVVFKLTVIIFHKISGLQHF